jgi:DNA-binding MarR family transcriptional regulator
MNSGIQFQFKIPESSHGFLIYKLYAKWESGIKSLLKDLNLTHPQFVILTTSAWFVTFEHAPTQKELSDKTGIDVMTTSVVIRGLLKK